MRVQPVINDIQQVTRQAVLQALLRIASTNVSLGIRIVLSDCLLDLMS